ncbi:MAG: PilZ domain-containing protein [Hyphomicrobiaceae bacterium]
MAETVMRGQPERRQYQRATTPLYAELDGHRVTATDWSPDGIMVEDYPGVLPQPGRSIRLQVTLPYWGQNHTFMVQAAVVRTQPAKALFAARFFGLNEHLHELMCNALRHSIYGARDPAGQSEAPPQHRPNPPPELPVDVPMDLPAPPVAKARTRRLAVPAITVLIGLVCLGYAATTFQANRFSGSAGPAPGIETGMRAPMAWPGPEHRPRRQPEG